MRFGPLHDCGQLCGRGPNSPGDPRERAANRCALPDFDTSAWDRVPLSPMAEGLAHDIGIAVARSDEETGLDIEVHGCPRSWVLSRFAQSLAPFLGTRTWDGIRNRSPALERVLRGGTDLDVDRLLEAVALYEAHEDGAYDQAKEMLGE